MKTKVVIAAVVVLLAVVAWFLHSRHEAPRTTVRRDATASPSMPAKDAPRFGKLAGQSARALLLEEIRSARRLRTDAQQAAASVASARGSGEGATPSDEDDDRDYVQLAMGDVLPSIVACYETAHKTQPSLVGTLVVNFTIEGEPGTGGLVTDATIDAEQSEIKDAVLGDCVRDAVFSLEIDPPTSGGVVKVTFPFTFGRQ
ncbi:MAG TPA: AgmX/PglI C-terminal domain-containing protein [Kofleriaceae bacterium]